MKIEKKKLVLPLMVLFGIGLVMAVATYYALFAVTLTINQPISVTGDLAQTVGCDSGDTCIGDLVRVDNSDNEERTITITNNNWNDDVEVNYVGKLLLENKDSSWDVISDGTKADFYYFITGEEMGYRLEAIGLQGDTEYSVIYYADKPDRFNEWGGNNPGALIVEATSDGSGNLIVDGRVDLNMDLPHENDANVNTDETDYCAVDGFDHCYGAKIWLVPSSDYDESAKKLIVWNQADYLFETDLIHYFDNLNGEYKIGADSFVEFYPLFTVNEYAPDWSGTITTTIA